MKTTLEEAREKNHDELVDSLQQLLEKNYDAENGFKKAVSDAKHADLKAYLKKQAVQRNRFATELDYEIRELNETPKENGSATATLHRAWIDLKTALSSNKDESILEECIRGEKASVEEYEDVLKNKNIPLQIENILNKQLADIRMTLSEVKTLEDLAEYNS